jgi:hypothetical protein
MMMFEALEDGQIEPKTVVKISSFQQTQPNRCCRSFSPEDRKRSSLQNVVFCSEYPMSDKFRNPVILRAIHYNENTKIE